MSVKFKSGDEHVWWFTGVYGPHQDAEKIAFLDEIREVRANCGGPWMMAGDFNMIYSVEDKNNKNLNRAKMGRFCQLVNDLELKEIPLMRRHYTWSNERDAPTLVKLDHVLCTADWEALYPECILQSHASEISHHCSLFLGLKEGIHGKKRFHFESFRTKLEGIQKVVEQSWSAPVTASCPLEAQEANMCSSILESEKSC